MDGDGFAIRRNLLSRLQLGSAKKTVARIERLGLTEEQRARVAQRLMMMGEVDGAVSLLEGASEASTGGRP